ncbi:MAG TPA: ABC transporter permease [Acidobacteriota bacterium]|jgi:peptide/nickel transport system permease protein
MIRYCLRRIINSLFLLAAVSVLTFLLFEIAPGNFLDELRLNPQVSEQTIANLKAKYALDQPIGVKYAQWARSVAHGDLGFSVAYNMAAAPLLWHRAANTLLLTVTAMVLSWLIAIPTGAWIAARRGKWQDILFGGANVILLAIPHLMLALILLLFALRSGLLPVGGISSTALSSRGWGTTTGDLMAHLVLPVLCLVLVTLPMLLPHVRRAVSDVLDSPFILAARARGLPDSRLLVGHALRASANPVISLFGLSISELLSSSLLVEIVMSWPGLGRLLLEAILARDFHLVVGCVLLSTAFLAGGNLIADLLLYASDPRIRAKQ